MSYILEALKKSDKERQKDEIPDLQTDHSLPPLRRQERKASSWRFPVAVALAFLGGGLLWWQFGTEKTVPPVVAEYPVVTPALLSAQEPQVPAKQRFPAKPVGLLSGANAGMPKGVSPVVDLPVKEVNAASRAIAEKKYVRVRKRVALSPPEPVLPLLEELPVAIRAGIPELSFAGHVYSDVPQKRLIIINNRIVREGDLIANGLSLEKIDSDGVVLRYETSVFRVKLF